MGIIRVCQKSLKFLTISLLYMLSSLVTCKFDDFILREFVGIFTNIVDGL